MDLPTSITGLRPHEELEATLNVKVLHIIRKRQISVVAVVNAFSALGVLKGSRTREIDQSARIMMSLQRKIHGPKISVTVSQGMVLHAYGVHRVWVFLLNKGETQEQFYEKVARCVKTIYQHSDLYYRKCCQCKHKTTFNTTAEYIQNRLGHGLATERDTAERKPIATRSAMVPCNIFVSQCRARLASTMDWETARCYPDCDKVSWYLRESMYNKGPPSHSIANWSHISWIRTMPAMGEAEDSIHARHSLEYITEFKSVVRVPFIWVEEEGELSFPWPPHIPDSLLAVVARDSVQVS